MLLSVKNMAVAGPVELVRCKKSHGRCHRKGL